MHSEFQPYKEGEPMYITIKRAKGLMRPVWPDALLVLVCIVSFAMVIGALLSWATAN
jgi:hypothetical protein